MVDDPTPSRHERLLGPRPGESLGAALMLERVHARMFGEPTPPTRIGRFRVSETIGSGGMGTVYAAWDETLDRPVALKFLNRRAGEDLVREAQALARLSHPHVVTVFDVGVHEGRVWLAMELVQGRTLRAWQREGASRSELLAAWLAAGQGLAAVHDAGLIHRDVKPDNVLRGDEGRVRLIDFGLVLARASEPTEPTQRGVDESSESTASRGFVGTREYAAPEQCSGAAIDARADQYAFCVSVWEALSGARPPRDAQGKLLVRALPGVPRRIVAALVRGLAPAPEQRWPSMHALLDRLAPRHRGGRVLAPSLAAALALAFVLVDREPSSPALDMCAQAGAALEDRVVARLEPGPLRSAAEQWIDEWRGAAEQACHEQRIAPLPARYEARTRCLERRRVELVGVLDHLVAVSEGKQVLDTRRLVLDEPRTCLRDTSPDSPPPEQRERIAAIELALADLDRRRTERARALVPEAEQQLARARATGWAPTIAEAALVLARIEIRAGRIAPARALLGEALDLAVQLDAGPLARRAWSGLVELEIDLALDPEAAQWAWQRESRALAELGPTALERGGLASQAAAIASLRGDLGASEAALREAVAAYEQAGFAGRLRLVTTLERLAFVVGASGREQDMLALQQRARAAELELDASARAADDLASSADHDFDRGQLALLAGRHDEAAEQLERALIGYRQASGSESPRVAQTHVALAQVYDATGALDDAEHHAEQADAICLATLGPAHPLRAATLSALGTIALRRGDAAVASAAFRVALRIEQTRAGGGGADLALARSNLAEALIAGRELDEARTQAELALTELRAALPPDHPDLAYPHKALGWVLLELGDLAGAREHLRSAMALPSWSDVEMHEIAALLARATGPAG